MAAIRNPQSAIRNGWLVIAVCGFMTTGCVDRRYVITSDPPGAVVYRNGQMIGATPVDDHFVYYGDYEFMLVKEGYQTRVVKQHIPAPWYEYVPIDFFSENLWPHRLIDVRRFNYDLEPLPAVRTDVLLDKAQELRNRGMAIVPRAEPVPATVTNPPPPPPPGMPVVGNPPLPADRPPAPPVVSGATTPHTNR
jgi:hypothetical protein